MTLVDRLSVTELTKQPTSMDSGVRRQRHIIQEWGDIYKLPLCGNNHLASLLAVAVSC